VTLAGWLAGWLIVREKRAAGWLLKAWSGWLSSCRLLGKTEIWDCTVL